MKNLYLLVVGTVVCFFAFSVRSEIARVVLDDSSATASTSYGNRNPRYAVNGAGLTGDQHTAQAANNVAWLSASDSNPTSNEWFRIDLGQVMPIDHVKIWNFNWDLDGWTTLERGVKDVDFYVSSSMTDPGHYYTNSALWTLAVNAVVAKAPGLDTYTGEPDISLNGVEGRWLLMYPLSNHGGDSYAGISEIQVFTDVMPEWKKHMDVTLSGYTGSRTLTDFPCALRLSEDIPGFNYRSFSSPDDGADLRVTTIYGDPLCYEIEKWNPNGTSVVWVAVDNLEDNTKTIKLHWNNADAEMPVYATNGTFWSSSYGGVWHLDQSDALDSTTNRNDGSSYGNVTVTGLLGDGQYFNGNDYIRVEDSASIGADVTSSHTISMWLKADATLGRDDDGDRMLEKGDCYFIVNGWSNVGGVGYLVKTNSAVLALGNGADVSSNEWHHVCGVYNGTNMYFYLDGVQSGHRSLTNPIDDDGLPLRIGSDDSGHYFSGVLDETRIESVARNTDWIKACYDNQKEKSDFLEYSAVYPAYGTMILIQ